MWLTGFDVPFLDTIYIDKPIQRHNLIQTISRVNRKYLRQRQGPDRRLHRHQKADEPGPGRVQQSRWPKHRRNRAIRHRRKRPPRPAGQMFHSSTASPYFTGRTPRTAPLPQQRRRIYPSHLRPRKALHVLGQTAQSRLRHLLQLRSPL